MCDTPLRLGAPEEFGFVRGFFQSAGFADVALCRRLGIEDMSQLDRVQWEERERENLSAPLRWCLRVFARGLLVSEAESCALCGGEVFAAFLALGLLRPARLDPSALLCPVWLYPVDGWVVASDRRDAPEDKSFTPPEDVVFPAIYGGTLRFLELLPDARGGDALDLCGGSGIGALCLARTARSAATADLTPRSAFFAEFNARLNGVRMDSFCGDLYAPVSGRQFDLIAAHPPFVPATGQNMVYRDGGHTGEEVTRRVVEGLPAHLRSGGACLILCVARDTADQTFEQRARDWLGSSKDEFDIVFGLEKVLTVEEVVESMRQRGQRLGDDQARQLLERLRSLGTRQFVYGALFIKRYPAPMPQPPARLHLTLAGRAADFESVLAWRRHCRQPGFERWLAEARPRLAPQLELTARHLVSDGELAPAEFIFSISGGFEARLRPDAWVVPLLARLNGTSSIAEVFEHAATADELPKGFTLDAFAGLVRSMIERGFFQADFPH
jgi:methylase of polypeptide subunit release factors